jgi:hypothetical protein
VSTLHRWGLAVPLTILSMLFLGATILGIWAFWGDDTTAQHTITVIITVLFAVNVVLSLSIGVDRRITAIPWLRLITIAVIFLLGCGALLLRRSLY